MAIAVNGVDGNPPTTRDIDATANNFVFTVSKLAFSGSYATGGDTLDLTTLAGLVPSGSLPINAFAEGNGTGTSQSAGGGYYAVLLGTSISTSKIKIFSAGGAELAAGAYPVAVTGDVVTLNITWRKLL